jgi:tetratricopeptide (TPR) repeat protein
MENLDNGAEAYFEAKNYQKAIHYYELYIERYHGDVTLFDIQNAYWYIIFSHAALGELNKVKETYEKSKAIYSKMGAGVRDATKKFIFIAKKYFLFAVDEKKDFEKIIPEIQWFLEQRSFSEIASEEVGLMHYYLGFCYKETNEPDKAIATFQKCIDQLEDEEIGYYYDKSEEAAEFIKELGGKPEGGQDKKKGLLGRFWK